MAAWLTGHALVPGSPEILPARSLIWMDLVPRDHEPQLWSRYGRVQSAIAVGLISALSFRSLKRLQLHLGLKVSVSSLC